ncbi:hypothetical protein [Actinophytocola sediminis]
MADAVHGPAATAHTVTARKPFTCHGYRCYHRIQPGEQYVRHVAFPGHDCNGGSSPWVMRICADCHAPADMPPPMRRRTRTT